MSRKPYTGIVKLYDQEDDHTLRDKYLKVNDKIEGIYERYKDGHLWMKTHYVDGIPEGPNYTFNPRGNVVVYNTHVHGKRHGHCFEYYNTGGRVSKLSGEYTYKLSGEYTYREDKIHGEFWQYYSTGGTEVWCTYDNGLREGEYTSYFEDGCVHEYYVYKKGKKHGIHIKYYEDSPTRKEVEAYYIDDKLEGPFKCYYINGTVMEECTFHQGRLHGEYRYYSHEDGSLIERVYYDHGVEVEQANESLEE